MKNTQELLNICTIKTFYFFQCAWIKWLILAKKTFENNGIEVIVDGIGTLSLNQKHIKEKLCHKNLPVTDMT